MIKTNKEIIQNFGGSEANTGSTHVQIALLTNRIAELTEHLTRNPKDFSSKRGMLDIVSQRKRLLRYLGRVNPAVYKATVERLGLKG